MSSADGPKRGKTPSRAKRGGFCPSRRETARREQAKRDNNTVKTVIHRANEGAVLRRGAPLPYPNVFMVQEKFGGVPI